MGSDWPVRVRSGSSFEYNNRVNIYFGTGSARTYRRRVTTPVFDVAIKDPPSFPPSLPPQPPTPLLTRVPHQTTLTATLQPEHAGGCLDSLRGFSLS